MQATQENKKQNFTGVQPVITLWKQTSKDGKTNYFSGYHKDDKVVGFYVSKKSNPNQPDLQIYNVDAEGKASDQCASLWCKVSKAGNKYLTGQYVGIDDKIYLKGFIQNNENPKYPYIKIYLDSELDNAKPKQEPTIKPSDFETQGTKVVKTNKKEKLPF